MKETIVLLKVTHDKPLPELSGQKAAEHFYNWAHAKGSKVVVTATLVEVPPELGTREEK